MFFARMTLLFLLVLSFEGLAMDKLNKIEKIQVTLTPAILEDSTGLVYIGYPVSKALVAPYLAQVKALVGDTRYKVLRNNQAARDHDSFHITLINPFEHPDVKSIELKDIPPIRFEFVGVGRAAKNDNQTFFVVVDAKKAQQVRANYQLKAKDFHVTLGFDKTDVFGVSKGLDSLLIAQ